MTTKTTKTKRAPTRRAPTRKPRNGRKDLRSKRPKNRKDKDRKSPGIALKSYPKRALEVARLFSLAPEKVQTALLGLLRDLETYQWSVQEPKSAPKKRPSEVRDPDEV